MHVKAHYTTVCNKVLNSQFGLRICLPLDKWFLWLCQPVITWIVTRCFSDMGQGSAENTITHGQTELGSLQRAQENLQDWRDSVWNKNPYSFLAINKPEKKTRNHESIFMEPHLDSISTEPHHESISMVPYHKSISTTENILKYPLWSSSQFSIDFLRFGTYIDFKWLFFFIDTKLCGWWLISSLGLSLELNNLFYKCV